MKKLLLFAVLITTATFAQVPQLINYQGVARSANGNAITNNISVRFEILQGNNTVVFTEDQPGLTPNNQGVFSTQIGKITNSLSSVSWSQGPYSLRVSVDTTGLSNYVTAGGIQPLASVPFALNAPSPALTVSNNVLSVGSNTVQLPAQAGLQQLSLNGNALAITGGNTVTLPSTPLTGQGATTVNPNGNGYIVSSPVISVNELRLAPPSPSITGIAQVLGTYPNFSVVVAPEILYNQNTGSLTLQNSQALNLLGASGVFTVSYYITPDLTMPTPGVLRSGPSSNTVDINRYTPWRSPTNALTTVTLANSQASVGIGVNTPTTTLHVDGFTKLGANSPDIQVAKIVTVTPSTANSSINITLPSVMYQGNNLGQLQGSKILSVSMLADPSNAVDWVGPDNTTAGYEYHWQITGNNLVIVTTANSANVINVPLKIFITYER